jgi:hypothetical protein
MATKCVERKRAERSFLERSSLRGQMKLREKKNLGGEEGRFLTQKKKKKK